VPARIHKACGDVGVQPRVGERPPRKAGIKRFGDTALPEGPILAVRVADLGEKEVVLAAQRGAFFTIPRFDGYPAVLIQLKNVSPAALREAITDGWLACAPTASWTNTSGAECGMSARRHVGAAGGRGSQFASVLDPAQGR